MSCDDSNATMSILTLGDGDFTYSLDLARFLALDGTHNWNLICTGIDTREELLAKYRDTPFVLNQLQSLTSPRLKISFHHSVNAILDPSHNDNGTSTQATTIGQVDHVMFHHPHLGTENAVLHGRFLCHFFHSCVNGWMKADGGFVHLTLVDGQYERWNCEHAATSQGLKLLQRQPFVPPPVDSPTYHYRRHQTGKSFESRRPSGSEAFVFGRNDSPPMDMSTLVLVSWPTEPPSKTVSMPMVSPSVPVPSCLTCPYCDRMFKEERSRKCHLRDKHPNASDKKTKTENSSLFTCSFCKAETDERRNFESEQALHDHIRAKHSAIHKTVIPDWCNRQGTPSPGQDDTGINGSSITCYSCAICHAKFSSKDEERTHLDSFKPCASSKEFKCEFCEKSFREVRAKLQHENFCSNRHQ